MKIYQRSDEEINNEELLKSNEEFLKNSRNNVESNHPIKGRGFFTMTDEEVERCLKERENHTESNHPFEHEGDFMDMLIEGSNIYKDFLKRKAEQEGK